MTKGGLLLGLTAFALAGSASLSTLPAQAAAQSPGPATQAIRGRVVDARDNAPLRRARVSVTTGTPPRTQAVFTDDEGRFLLADAPATSLTVRITKTGYAASVIATGAPPVTEPLQVSMTRGAAISGRVTDEVGAPANLVYVTARATGPESASLPPALRRIFVQTDPLGEYRLGTLPPATWQVTAVSIRPERRDGDATIEGQLFERPDDLLTTETTTLTLRPGEEAQNIDFLIQGTRLPCPGDARRSAPPRDITSAQISGRVTGADGVPLACAQIRAIGPGVDPLPVNADTQGRYFIDGLVAGTYYVEAFSPRYVNVRYGQRIPADPETPIELREDERRAGIDIVLPRTSIVSGTLVNEQGEPMEGISVQVLQVQPRGNSFTVSTSAFPRPTDDRGQFRAIGLRPGAYVVVALGGAVVSSDQERRAYGAVYYPGTTNAALAERIVLSAGQDVTGLSLTFTPVTTMEITGSVMTAAGQPFAGSVNVVPSARSGAMPIEIRGATIAADGSFVVRNVPPGDYTVKAWRGQGGQPVPFGMEFVTITDRSPSPLRIVVSEGSDLRGRLLLEGAPDINLAGMGIAPTSADADFTVPGAGPNRAFTRNADNTFIAVGVMGPLRLLINGTPACESCYLKAARINGIDALITPVDLGMQAVVYRDAEVVISDAGASVQGRALAAPNRPAAAYRVALIPVLREQWFPDSPFLKSVGSRADGTFRITGIAPGEYVVAALSRFETGVFGGELNDPQLLEELLARGERVTLSEREQQTVELPLIRR